MNFLGIFIFLYSIHANSQDILGSWKQGCVGGTERFEFFSENNVTMVEIFSSVSDCSQSALKISNSGNYFLFDQNIDFTFTGIRIELLQDLLVRQFNSRKVCGFSDWTLSSPKDVTGLACDLFGIGKKIQMPIVGEMRYGIWKVNQEKLFFGKLTSVQSALTPEKRPTEWDPRPWIRYQ